MGVQSQFMTLKISLSPLLQPYHLQTAATCYLLSGKGMFFGTDQP